MTKTLKTVRYNGGDRYEWAKSTNRYEWNGEAKWDGVERRKATGDYTLSLPTLPDYSVFHDRPVPTKAHDFKPVYRVDDFMNGDWRK